MSFDQPEAEKPGNPWARAERRRRDVVIPTPTVAQAFAHLIRAVAEADRRGVKSPTIEAIRVLTSPVEGPKTQQDSAGEAFASQPEHQ